MDVPETRYTTTADGVSIAYQVLGDDPPDIVAVNSAFLSHLELAWDWPFQASIFRGLAERGRLVLFDRRGAGLSDKVSGDHLPTLEARMDDIRAVMEAAGCERPVLLGVEDGSSLCLLFGATHPQRTKALVLFNPVSRGLWAPDAPWLGPEEEWNEEIRAVQEGWGTSAFFQGLVESIGARVVAQAGPSEVVVSQTVKDLVAGSGLVFEDAGEHELKGVPDRWRLYRVVG